MQESTDLTSGLIQMFTNFRSGWFLGITTLCYLAIQLLRGKAGFELPYLTPWLEKQSKEVKTYVIVLFFALAGGFSAFAATTVTFTVILDGFLKGLALGVGTIGTRSVLKQGVEVTKVYIDQKKNGKSETNKIGE